MGKTVNELVVKIAEAQKGADIFDLCWGGPVFDARNFYWDHASHPLFKNYPQVINTGNMKMAFGQFDEEVVRGEEVEGVMDSGNVVLDSGTGANNDVIHVNTDNCPS